MKPKARFIRSIVATARAEAVDMPWARGTRRADMIARRDGTAFVHKRRLHLA